MTIPKIINIDTIAEDAAVSLEQGLTRVIKQALIQKVWSKQTLAERAGIAQSTISVIMAGGDKGRSWTLKQLIRVAIALDISLAELIAAAESGEELPGLMIDLAGTEPCSKERLTRIVQSLATKGTSKDVLDLYFTAAMLEISVPKLATDYYAGAVDDREVYNLLTRVNDSLGPEENLWGKLSAFMAEPKADSVAGTDGGDE